MPISDDNRRAQRVGLSFLSVTADSPVMNAIKSHQRILYEKERMRTVPGQWKNNHALRILQTLHH